MSPLDEAQGRQDCWDALDLASGARRGGSLLLSRALVEGGGRHLLHLFLPLDRLHCKRVSRRSLAVQEVRARPEDEASKREPLVSAAGGLRKADRGGRCADARERDHAQGSEDRQRARRRRREPGDYRIWSCTRAISSAQGGFMTANVVTAVCIADLKDLLLPSTAG